jgi:hypothetical protein
VRESVSWAPDPGPGRLLPLRRAKHFALSEIATDGWNRPRVEPEPTRRQRHRRNPIECDVRPENGWRWRTIALLVNPSDPVRAETFSREVQAAADHLGLQLHILRARSEPEIKAAFAGFAQLKAGVLVIGGDAFNSRSKLLPELSLYYAVPAIHEYLEFTEAGGLISYGGSIKESYRWAGIYRPNSQGRQMPSPLPALKRTSPPSGLRLRFDRSVAVATRRAKHLRFSRNVKSSHPRKNISLSERQKL